MSIIFPYNRKNQLHFFVSNTMSEIWQKNLPGKNIAPSCLFLFFYLYYYKKHIKLVRKDLKSMWWAVQSHSCIFVSKNMNLLSHLKVQKMQHCVWIPHNLQFSPFHKNEFLRNNTSDSYSFLFGQPVLHVVNKSHETKTQKSFKQNIRKYFYHML